MVDDSKIYQIIVAKYTGIVSEADKLELRFGKINLNERKNILIRAMNREKQILGVRLEGKRKAGLDGGEDLEIFNMIDTYLKQ
jgi:tRNA A22 N-methylase